MASLHPDATSYDKILYHGCKPNILRGGLFEIWHYKALCQTALHAQIKKRFKGTEQHHVLEIRTCDPLGYKIGLYTFIVLTCTGKVIKIIEVYHRTSGLGVK